MQQHYAFLFPIHRTRSKTRGTIVLRLSRDCFAQDRFVKPSLHEMRISPNSGFKAATSVEKGHIPTRTPGRAAPIAVYTHMPSSGRVRPAARSKTWHPALGT